MKNMRLPISLSFLALIIIVSTAFIGVDKKDNSKSVVGNYGDKGDHPTLQLKINEDYTFHYIDESRSDEKINVSGKWSQKGNKILLEDFGSKKGIPVKWELDKNQPCVRGRQGMKFIRICSC